MNKQLITIIIILLVIVVGVVIYNNSSKPQIQLPPPTPQPVVDEQQKESNEVFKQTLVVRHEYKDGIHKYTGQFQVPNPCFNYALDVKDVNGTKMVEITYVKPTVETCPITTPADKGFSVSFPGEPNETIRLKLDGEEVNLNIVEV